MSPTPLTLALFGLTLGLQAADEAAAATAAIKQGRTVEVAPKRKKLDFAAVDELLAGLQKP